MTVSLDVAYQQDTAVARSVPWEAAVAETLALEGFSLGEVSLVIVDADTMHGLNRKHLDHDYTTDVLSFVYDCDEASGLISGEIIVSCDYAQAEAEHRGWSASQELTLYALHGALHLAGYDDIDDDDRSAMRAAERRHLTRLFDVVPDTAVESD